LVATLGPLKAPTAISFPDKLDAIEIPNRLLITPGAVGVIVFTIVQTEDIYS
jgi:hypothetical protein